MKLYTDSDTNSKKKCLVFHFMPFLFRRFGGFSNKDSMDMNGKMRTV